MLATSWKAKGLVQAAWKQLPVDSYKREELARLTGIPASNLSGMNTGRVPMTMASAQKIMRAVPGLTLLDLGAPEAEGGDTLSLSALDRLERLEASLERVLLALDSAGIELPAEPADSRSSPSAPRRRARSKTGTDG